MPTENTPRSHATGPITLRPPTVEQQGYLDVIIAANMTPEQIEQCTCVFGGPKPLDKRDCPVHGN